MCWLGISLCSHFILYFTDLPNIHAGCKKVVPRGPTWVMCDWGFLSSASWVRKNKVVGKNQVHSLKQLEVLAEHNQQ